MNKAFTKEALRTMKLVRQVPLMLVETGQVVDAEVYSHLEMVDLIKAESSWQAYRATSAEHGHWRWTDKIPNKGSASNELYGLWHNNECQGLMELLMDRESRSSGTFGLPLVYINYLEVAPWNLPSQARQTRYTRVGSLLAYIAVLVSKISGMSGRCGLHSLPQAAGFYRIGLGMTDLGEDWDYGNMTYFEFTEAQASIFLSKQGLS